MNKSIPTIFGCPLWEGKISRKMAKKYFSRWKYSMMDTYRWQSKVIVNGKPFNETGVGDLINSCSGFNETIAKIIPDYRNFGRGYVLIGIDVVNDRGGYCSIKHCGVEPPWSREMIEKYHVSFLKKYILNQEEPFPISKTRSEEIDKALRQIALIEAGEHICDEQGIKFQ